MNSIISALGVILSSILDLSSSITKASSSSEEKRNLGKTLSQLLLKIEDVMTRAAAILVLIKRIPNEEENFAVIKEALLEVIKKQSLDLNEIGEIIKGEFLWGFKYEYESIHAPDLLHNETNIYRILSTYEPYLGKKLGNIIEYKSNLLNGLSRLLNEEISTLDENKLFYNEVSGIGDVILASQMGKICFERYPRDEFNNGGWNVEFESINLKEEKSVNKYTNNATRRLNELKESHQKIKEIIVSKFSIEDLL